MLLAVLVAVMAPICIAIRTVMLTVVLLRRVLVDITTIAVDGVDYYYYSFLRLRLCLWLVVAACGCGCGCGE